MFLTVDGVSSEDTQESARYRCLWLAVILRAKHDVDGRDLMASWDGGEGELRRNAQNWLCATGGPEWEKDLREICELANVDPDNLIQLSRRRKYGMSDE